MDFFTNEQLGFLLELLHSNAKKTGIASNLIDVIIDELDRREELAEFADECEGGACKL